MTRLEGAMVGLKDKGCLSIDMSRACAAKIWISIGHEMSSSSIVNIRSIETERYKVIDKIKDEILEEIEVYEGVFYMNQGITYFVTHLGLSNKIAWCQQADAKYYTKLTITWIST